MKYFILLFVCFCTSLSLHANTDENNVFIKGKIRNFKAKFWLLEKTGFFDSEVVDINTDKDGNFVKKVSLEGEQNLTLYLNNSEFRIHVKVGDTLQIYADQKNFENTFTVQSPDQKLSRQFDFNIKKYLNFRKQDSILKYSNLIVMKKDEATTFKLINDNFNSKIRQILQGDLDEDIKEKLIISTYYESALHLFRRNLLSRYLLKSDSTLLDKREVIFINKYLLDANMLKTINTKFFYECPEYRDFIFFYAKPSPQFNFTKAIKEEQTNYVDGNAYISYPKYTKTKFYNEINKIEDPSLPWTDYYHGLINFSLIPVRDWFITKNIFLAYQYYSVEETEKVVEEFLKKCETKVFRDTLLSFRNNYMAFKKGSPAPNFVLKDSNDLSVRMSQFKGKLIYIDFWGTSCPPCMYEINNYSQVVQEKYRGKDVIFINICVDSDSPNWKKTIARLKNEGINLLAEGWTKNKVCQEYKIDALPHYVLLDRNGDFLNYQAPRPSELVKQAANLIDIALKAPY